MCHVKVMGDCCLHWHCLTGVVLSHIPYNVVSSVRKILYAVALRCVRCIERKRGLGLRCTCCYLLPTWDCNCTLSGCYRSCEDASVGGSAERCNWWPRQVHLHHAGWVRVCLQVHQTARSRLHLRASQLYELSHPSQASGRPAPWWVPFLRFSWTYCLCIRPRADLNMFSMFQCSNCKILPAGWFLWLPMSVIVCMCIAYSSPLPLQYIIWQRVGVVEKKTVVWGSNLQLLSNSNTGCSAEQRCPQKGRPTRQKMSDSRATFSDHWGLGRHSCMPLWGENFLIFF